MSTVAQKAPGHVRIALCQVPVSNDKVANIRTAVDYMQRAKQDCAQLVVLPECFNCPYDTKVFKDYAEPVAEPGTAVETDLAAEERRSPTIAALRRTAKELSIFLVGGSVPEVGADGRIFNTSATFDPDGNMIAKHRKVHLFDVDVPGGIRFKESDALAPGERLTLFSGPTYNASNGAHKEAETNALRVGVGICYDIRFPELSMAMTRAGQAGLLVFPGAFNMTTGPAHWELLVRARAVDNQVYAAVCSPARWDEKASYTPWGHSTIVDPWGSVIATTGHAPDIVVADIDPTRIDHVRAAIPTSRQRCPNVYSQLQK